MNVLGTDNFQYIQLEKETRRYLCLQQNVLVLFWILFFKKDTIRTKVRSECKLNSLKFAIDCFPKRDLFSFFKNNFITLLKFIVYKYQWRKAKSLVRLPLYGHTCVQVHKGYKIFDLRREVVMKIFDQEVNSGEISEEIEQLKIVSQLNFAPSLRKWDLWKRWYEEDYFIGSVETSRVPLDSGIFLENFFQKILPYVTDLILFQNPLVKDKEEYVGNLIHNIEASWEEEKILPKEDIRIIKKFLNSIVDSLPAIPGSTQLFHVFTHGDFCPENILKTPHGLKVIDWESAKYRTALFDFYSYFFYRPFQKNVPIEALVCEINKALPFLISKISKVFPQLASSLSPFESLYRKIYYIERISMLMEREKTDKRLDIRSRIFRYIEAFESYEQHLRLMLSMRTEVLGT